jgi:hypothetical protein
MMAQLILDMPPEKYHGRDEWSNSQMTLLPDHPEEFYGRYVRLPKETRFPFKRTDAMELGTQLHSVLLENKPLLIIPQNVLSKSGSRAGGEWKRWVADHPDNQGVKESECDVINAMCDSCRNDEVVRGILDADGDVEATILWHDDETNLDLRSRLDKIVKLQDGYMITDLKSASIDVANRREVSGQIASFEYHRQAASYSDAALAALGKEPLRFVFIFVRSDVPYNAVAWYLNDAAINLGRYENRLALRDLRTRLDSGNWKAPVADNLNEIDLPNWKYADNPIPTAPYREFVDLQDLDIIGEQT